MKCTDVHDTRIPNNTFPSHFCVFRFDERTKFQINLHDYAVTMCIAHRAMLLLALHVKDN